MLNMLPSEIKYMLMTAEITNREFNLLKRQLVQSLHGYHPVKLSQQYIYPVGNGKSGK